METLYDKNTGYVLDYNAARVLHLEQFSIIVPHEDLNKEVLPGAMLPLKHQLVEVILKDFRRLAATLVMEDREYFFIPIQSFKYNLSQFNYSQYIRPCSDVIAYRCI